MRFVASFEIVHGAKNATDQGVLRVEAFNSIFSKDAASPKQVHELRNILLDDMPFHREQIPNSSLKAAPKRAHATLSADISSALSIRTARVR